MPDRFHVAIRSGLQLDNPSTLDPFLSWLTGADADLVVWDVFNRLHTKDEKRPDQMLPILKHVDRIRDELGCANLIAHHSRKPSASGPDLASGGQKLRGPSEFGAWSENSIYLASLKGKGNILVEPESKDAIVEPFKAHLEDLPNNARRWVYDGVVQARVDQGSKTRQAIVEALANGLLSADAIAEQTGRTSRSVKAHLSALGKDGAVDFVKEPGRAGRRLWMLTTEEGAAGPAPGAVTTATV
jgi:DNA-binding transcriptional ArsR family regulator